MRGWLEREEAARACDVTPQHMSRLLESGEIIGERDRFGRWQVDRLSVEDFLEARAAKRDQRARRKAEQKEKGKAFARERERDRIERDKLRAREAELHEREVVALETIARAASSLLPEQTPGLAKTRRGSRKRRVG